MPAAITVRGASAYRRLSDSPLWDAARRFYARAGVEAWRTATVPHHVTSNVALATAYARVVLGFLRDTAGRRSREGGEPREAGEPLYVVELGAGSGRFAFLFLRALEALDPRAPIRYVMTDVADATIEFWRRHAALAPFVRSGRLDFARFDAESDRVLRFERARRTIAPGAPAASMVVIASYVFSALRQDAFAMSAGGLRDYLVTARPNRNGRAADITLTWRVGARATTPYPEPAYNALLAEVARINAAHGGRTLADGRTGANGRGLFPIGALRCLDRLAALARDAGIFLVADRATTAGAADLGAARHGAVSFPVSFAALRRHVLRQGGVALPAARAARELHVAGFLRGRHRAWPATRHAFRHALAGAKLQALYRARHAITAGGSAAALLALMRRAGPDPRAVAECIRPLWPHLADADARLRREVRDAILAAWPNYFHLGEPHDLPFDFGLVLYQVRAYADARALFEESLRLYGDDAATWWNLALCDAALGRPHAARTAIRRAQQLASGFVSAGPATVKLVRGARGISPRAQRGARRGPLRPPESTDSRPSSAARDSAGRPPRRRAPRRRSSSRRRR